MPHLEWQFSCITALAAPCFLAHFPHRTWKNISGAPRSCRKRPWFPNWAISTSTIQSQWIPCRLEILQSYVTSLASGGIPVASSFHRNHTISHRNPSGGVFLSTGRKSLGKTSPEGLPVTQNPTGSVSALPVSLPAGTLRGGVYGITATCAQIFLVFTFRWRTQKLSNGISEPMP